MAGVADVDSRLEIVSLVERGRRLRPTEEPVWHRTFVPPSPKHLAPGSSLDANCESVSLPESSSVCRRGGEKSGPDSVLEDVAMDEFTDFSPSHFPSRDRTMSYASKVSSNSNRLQGSKNRESGSHGLKIRGWTSLHGPTNRGESGNDSTETCGPMSSGPSIRRIRTIPAANPTGPLCHRNEPGQVTEDHEEMAIPAPSALMRLLLKRRCLTPANG